MCAAWTRPLPPQLAAAHSGLTQYLATHAKRVDRAYWQPVALRSSRPEFAERLVAVVRDGLYDPTLPDIRQALTTLAVTNRKAFAAVDFVQRVRARRPAWWREHADEGIYTKLLGACLQEPATHAQLLPVLLRMAREDRVLFGSRLTSLFVELLAPVDHRLALQVYRDHAPHTIVGERATALLRKAIRAANDEAAEAELDAVVPGLRPVALDASPELPEDAAADIEGAPQERKQLGLDQLRGELLGVTTPEALFQKVAELQRQGFDLTPYHWSLIVLFAMHQPTANPYTPLMLHLLRIRSGERPSAATYSFLIRWLGRQPATFLALSDEAQLEARLALQDVHVAPLVAALGRAHFAPTDQRRQIAESLLLQIRALVSTPQAFRNLPALKADLLYAALFGDAEPCARRRQSAAWWAAVQPLLRGRLSA